MIGGNSQAFLFTGLETWGWTPEQFNPLIDFCLKHNLDGIIVKAYEITQGYWYNNKFDAIYTYILGSGLECIPYGFFYGGLGLSTEIQAALKFLTSYGVFCIDMESDFDGNVVDAKKLALGLDEHPGELWVSTWANVADHNYIQVIDALKYVTQIWMPQVYTEYLALRAVAQWPKVMGIMPTLKINQDFGVNNPERYTSLFGASDISIWEYQECVKQPDVLTKILTNWKAGPQLFELVGYPLLNQRTWVTHDGRPSENRDFGCVYTALLSAIFYYKPELKKTVVPDDVKDSVLGELYTGGTDIRDFVAYSNHYGIDVVLYTGNTTQDVIREAHRQLGLNHASLFTQQDDYSSNRNYTHVCGFYKEVAGGIVFHDPFGQDQGDEYTGRSLTYSDAEMANRLRSTELWIIQVKDVPMDIDINTPGIKSFYTQDANGHWVLLKNPKLYIMGDILKYYKHGSRSGTLGGMTDLGLVVSLEEKVTKGGKELVTPRIQHFERGDVVYDPNDEVDAPPGHVGTCYVAHIDGLHSQVDSLASQVTLVSRDLSDLKIIVTGLEQQVAAGVKPFIDLVTAVAAKLQTSYEEIMTMLDTPPSVK